MAKYVLGTPYKRGKSDVIDSCEETSGQIAAGLAVTKKSDGTLQLPVSGALVGVAGAREPKNHQSVIRRGLDVAVRLAEGAAPSAEKTVYINAAGEFTDAAKTGETANTATGAAFTSGVITGVDPNTMVDVANCALIDMLGGL